MKIIAYQFNADTYCIKCTLRHLESGNFYDENGDIFDGDLEIDSAFTENGDGVYPIFDGDEWYDSSDFDRPIQFLVCGNSRGEYVIDTYTIRLSVPIDKIS